MAHGLPLATGPHSCGAPGAFFLDVGISSTDHIAAFWGLQERPVLALSTAAHVVPVTTVLDAGDLGLQAPGTTDPAPIGAVEVALGSSDGAKASPIDPSAVIAAALKAAGIGHVKSGTTGHGGPGPIIEAALKAAGIMKR